jgi:hypothetical protein
LTVAVAHLGRYCSDVRDAKGGRKERWWWTREMLPANGAI